MSKELLLAVDAGTGSCRAVLFSLDGTQLAIGQREYSHAGVATVPGSQVFAAEHNWRLICECIHEVLASATAVGGAIRAVSATSMREGMVLYDERGREIWACPNVDSRASVEARELVESGAAQEIYEQAGDWVAITAPARFRWIARHEPKLFARIARVGMIGDWMLTRLSGEFVTDPSLGSSSGMFDLAQRTWSDSVLDVCEVDRTVFPPVVDPGTVIGGVTAQAAAETGLSAGIPVVVGGADTQLALLGIGMSEPDAFAVVGGSFWQQTLIVDRPLVDPHARLRTLCHTVPGRWMVEGIGFYCGLVMRWFRDAFCELESSRAELDGIDVYALLEREAADLPPGSHGVFGIFSNVMHASQWVHASPAFVGFDLTQPATSTKAACFRAIQESAAYVSRAHLEIVEEIAATEAREVVFTSGAAQGRLWPQIVADTLGLPVRIPVVKESSALGAAIYAGLGVGLYHDPVATAKRIVRFERSVEPQAEACEAYDELYGRWRELYRRSLRLSEDDLVRPLWRAAGT